VIVATLVAFVGMSAVPIPALAAAERAERPGTLADRRPDPDLPWSGTIADAQRILADLGIYAGPSDGRLSPAFERALRTYEARYGAVGGVVGLRELLQPDPNTSQATAIRETLDKARKEQVDRATGFLLRNSATRDLMDRLPDDRADPTREAALCFDAPTARCLLAEAIETAKGVARDDYRNWAFRDILRTQTALGQLDDARESIRRLSDPRLKIVALREMAEELAQQDMLTDAIHLARTIPDPRNKAAALATIAVRHAMKGDRARSADLAQQTMETASHIDDIGLRVDTVTAMAQDLAENGVAEIARDLLSELRAILTTIPPGAARDAATGVLARAMAEQGANAEAAVLMAGLADAEISRALPEVAPARKGLPAPVDSSDSRYRVIVLAETARAKGALGDSAARHAALERALAVAEAIGSPFARDYGFGRILLVQAADGDAAAALRTAERIGDAALRSRALWSAAQILRRKAPVDVAASLERASAQAAEEAPSAFDRIAIACEQAIAFTNAGRHDAARILIRQSLATLDPIRIDWWRARALAVIAQAMQAVDSAHR